MACARARLAHHSLYFEGFVVAQAVVVEANLLLILATSK